MSPLGSVASACTTWFMPAPSGDHDVPFQRATNLAGTPPAVWKLPPTIERPAAVTEHGGELVLVLGEEELRRRIVRVDLVRGSREIACPGDVAARARGHRAHDDLPCGIGPDAHELLIVRPLGESARDEPDRIGRA